MFVASAILAGCASKSCTNEDCSATGTAVAAETPAPAGTLPPPPSVVAALGGKDPAADGPMVLVPEQARSEPTQSPVRHVASMTLFDAVAQAVSSHPVLGAQDAAVRGAGADVDYAGSGGRPTLTVSAGTGHATVGNFVGPPFTFDNGSSPGALRTDVAFQFRQMVYDFGAVRAEVQRTKDALQAERMKLADEAEAIALKTANAYLKILEQRQLLALIDETLAEHAKLAKLVEASQRDGNGTVADVQKIRSRMIEVRATRTDIDTELRGALDEFRRLVNIEPGQLRRPRDPANLIPRTLEAALDEAPDSNPGLLAYGAAVRSASAQIEAVDAQKMPKLEVQGEGALKTYSSVNSHSDLDVRAMVVVSYKLFDAGVSRAQTDRAKADFDRSRYRWQDEREAVELRLRKAYQARRAAGEKVASIASGVDAARNVKTLYLEQFRSGKKTIFEVLDSYMSLFALRRQHVTAEHDGIRASFEILRTLGRLSESVARQRL